MNTYFDKELLLQSSIFELRNIARDVGVASPTIYKKEELLAKIFQIINGEAKPHVPKSKQGRPPKSLASTVRKSVIDVVLPTTDNVYTMEDQEPLYLSESVQAFLENEKTVSKKIIEISGHLDMTPYGYGFVRKDREVYSAFAGAYISPKLIASCKLKYGDHIKGLAKVVDDDKPCVMYEIQDINHGQELRSYDFDSLDVTYSVMPFDCGEIKDFVVGAANLILQPKNSRKPITDFLPTDKRYTPIVVKLESSKEQEMIMRSNNHMSLYTTMLQSAAESVNLINLALAIAKRKASDGEDVVLYIDSIDLAIKSQNTCSGYDLLDIKAKSLDVVKKLSMAARQLLKVGSLTIVGSYNYSGISYDQEMTAILQDYFSKNYMIKSST